MPDRFIHPRRISDVSKRIYDSLLGLPVRLWRDRSVLSASAGTPGKIVKLVTCSSKLLLKYHCFWVFSSTSYKLEAKSKTILVLVSRFGRFSTLWRAGKRVCHQGVLRLSPRRRSKMSLRIRKTGSSTLNRINRFMIIFIWNTKWSRHTEKIP